MSETCTNTKQEDIEDIYAKYEQRTLENIAPPERESHKIKEFLDYHPHAYQEVLEFLYTSMKKGRNIEAAKVLADRLKGKPAISVDHRVTGKINLTTDDFALLGKRNIKDADYELIEDESIQLPAYTPTEKVESTVSPEEKDLLELS